jgi:hypothetical protein
MYNPANGSKPEKVLPDVDEGAGAGCSGVGPGGQHLKISIIPNGKCQQPEGKPGAERELHVESPRCNGLLKRILSASPFLVRFCRRRVVRYFEYDREKHDDARSISKMNTTSFRLVQTLSWSNRPTSSIRCIMLWKNYQFACSRCVAGYYFYSQENRLMDMVNF